MPLPRPLRLLLGMLALIVGLIAYAIGAVAVWEIIGGQHWALDVVYFTLAGLAWALPARYLVAWMSRMA